MDFIVEIYNTIIGNTLYTILAIAFLILLGFGLIKKLFKLTLVVIACVIVYIGFIYFTEGPEKAASTVDEMGQTLEDLGESVEEAIDGAKEQLNSKKDK